MWTTNDQKVCEGCGEVYSPEAEGGQECPECGIPGEGRSQAGDEKDKKEERMSEQLERITRKVCEEIGIQYGLEDPRAVMQNRKLRKLADQMIERALREENEPKPEGDSGSALDPRLPLPEGEDPKNGGATEIEMSLEGEREEIEQE